MKSIMKGKQLLAWLLVLVMVWSLLPVTSVSATGTDGTEDSTIQGAGDDSVTLTVADSPKLEIALAAGQTKVAYGDFKEKLSAALVEKGLDKNNISFLEVDANASASKNSFEWWRYDHSYNSSYYNNESYPYVEPTGNQSSDNDYNDENFHIVTSPDGTTMDFYGYGSSAYKDFNFLPNNQATKKTIEFTITEGTAYDALDGIGFFINTSITGTYPGSQVINGYLLFLQYNTSGVGIEKGIKLFKLTNVNAYDLHHGLATNGSFVFDGTTNKNGIQLIATADTMYDNLRYRKIKMEIMPEYLKMWYVGNSSSVLNTEWNDSHLVKWNNNTVTEYPLVAGYDTVGEEAVYRGGYGPISSYRSHSCSQLTHVTLSNLGMTSEYVRSLTEVIREPNWNDDKLSFLVNLNESPIEDFSEEFTTAELINRLEDDKVVYVGWGGNNNADESKLFVDGVGNGSSFVNVDNTEYQDNGDAYTEAARNKQIDAIADIIIARIKKENIDASTYTYLDTDDFTFTAVGTTLDDGNWSVGYNKDSFEDAKNSVSLYKDLSTASFITPGYYEIYYGGNTSAPKAKIRIHQAPIAKFSASIKTSGLNRIIDILDESYDPGFESKENKGIVSRKIEYRNLTDDDAQWSETAPASVKYGDVWLVRLTVTDAMNVTATTIQQLSIAESLEDIAPPYGTFTIEKTDYFTGLDNCVKIVDKSYCQDGSTDFSVSYTIKNADGNTMDTLNNGEITPSATYDLSLEGYETGTYYIEMTASREINGTTLSSEVVKKSFKVYEGYTITYVANGGTGSPASQYKIADQEITLSAIAPTKDGEIFSGWSDGNNVYQPGDKYNKNENLELTAIWTKPTYHTAAGYNGTYDGKEHTITVNVKEPSDGATILYGESDKNMNETSLPKKDAGSYDVYYQIAKEGYLTVSSYRTITIKKASPTITLEDKESNYTESAIEIAPAVVKGVSETDTPTGEVTYQYYMESACQTLVPADKTEDGVEGAAPKAMGYYYVVATVAADKNYNEVSSAPAKLVIKPIAEWVENGNTYAGTLEDALEAANKEGSTVTEITLLEDDTLDTDATIPEGVKLKVNKGVRLDIATGVTLTVNGELENNGTVFNVGTIAGGGNVTNNNKIVGGTISVPTDNNGTISDSRIEGTVNNDGTVEDSSVKNDGEIRNSDNGVIVEDGEEIQYTVKFVTDYREAPADQTLTWGSKIDEPTTLEETDTHKFEGWYKEQTCENQWDFSVNAINNDMSLYACWKEKTSYEATWKDNKGNSQYGTFEEALESGSTPITIQNDVTIKNDTTIPKGTEVVIAKDAKVTLAEDSSFTVDGTLQNNGVIDGNAKEIIDGNGEVINNGTLSDCVIKPDVTNGVDAVITNSTLDGTVTNNGTITNSVLNDKVINDGSITESKLYGDVTNNENGSISDSTIGDDTLPEDGPQEFINKGTVEDVEVNENVNFENDGKYVDEGVTKTFIITFIVPDGYTPLEPATVAYKGKVTTRLQVEADSDYTFTGWYTDNEYISKWDMDTDVVDSDTTLYAQVGLKADFQAYWTDGEYTVYGSLEEALKEGNTNVHIQKDITVASDTTIPEGVDVTIDEGKTLKVSTDVTLSVQGSLTNEGMINNLGTVDGEGNIVNAENAIITGGVIDADVTNNGTVTNATLGGNVTNNGSISNSVITGDVTNNNEIRNTTVKENGSIDNQDDGYIMDGKEFVECTVTFDENGYGTTPESQTVGCGTKITEPSIEAREGYGFEGWSTTTTGSKIWNFASDTVSNDITLYAIWKENTAYEARWTDKEGNTKYGSFKEALETGSAEVIIQNDVIINESLRIPSGMDVVVEDKESDVTITFTENGLLDVDGSFVNNGTISGLADATTPSIIGNITNNGTMNDIIMEGDLENDGVVSNSSIDGNVVNRQNGLIETSNISENLDNYGSVTGTTVNGDVTNKADAVITDSTLNGDVENNGTLDNSTVSGELDNTNGIIKDENGDIRQVTVSFNANGYDIDITPQTIHYGSKVVDPAVETIDKTVVGWYKEAACKNEWDFDTTVTKDITLYAKWALISSFEAQWSHNGGTKYGTLEDALASGSNEVILRKNTTVENLLSIPENVNLTIPSGVTLTVSENAVLTVDGELTNNGNVSNQGIINGEGVINNNKSLIGGEIVVDVQNAGTGTITDAVMSGDVVNDGTIMNSILSGNVTNNNYIWNSEITGESDNSNGNVIEDGTIVDHTVTFDAQNKANAPASQTVVYGKLISNPGELQNADYVFLGWFTESACENQWDFTTDAVKKDMTLYAGWRLKTLYEANWQDENGETQYGTFEESLQSGATPIHVQNTVVIADSLTIPESVEVIVDENATVTLVDNVVLNNDGKLTNKGTITGGSVLGDIVNDGTLSNSNITGDVTNNGNLSGGTVTGNVTNGEGATITNQIIVGGTFVNDGSMTDSKVSGDVTNNGDISASEITGDNITNNGTINNTEMNSNIITNNGTIEESIVTGEDNKVINNGTLDNTEVSEGTEIDNSNGTVTDENGTVMYTVSFEVGEHGVAPETQSIAYGKKVTKPSYPVDDEYTMMQWYADEAYTSVFDFENVVIKDNTTIYAQWALKSSFDAYWTEGEDIRYGSLEDALSSGSSDVLIQKDLDITENIEIPNGMNLTIDDNVTVTVEDGVIVQVDGTLANQGKLYNNGSLSGDGTITNEKTLIGGNIETSFVNNGNVTESVVTGDVVNNGKVMDSIIEGDMINNKEIYDTVLDGGLDNNGIVMEDGTAVEYVDHELKGTINLDDNTDGATVKLVRGNKQIKVDSTDADGKYSFSGVPSGIYNLVVETEDNVKTIMVEVFDDEIIKQDINLPSGNLNNVVEVKDGTPDVVVGNLETVFNHNSAEEDKGVTSDNKMVAINGGSVDVKLVVEQIADIPELEKAMEAVLSEDNKEIGISLDLSVFKNVTSNGDTTQTQLKELPEIILVNIPLADSLKGKENYVVYRYHNGEVDTITENKESGEYITVSSDKNSINLYTKKFSTYVIAYEKVKEPEETTTEDKPEETTTETKPEESTTEIKPEESTTEVDPETIVSKEQVEKNTLKINEGLKIDQIGSKIKVKWGKVSGATGYKIYVQYCGKKFVTKPTKTVKGASKNLVTITKVNGKKLNLTKNFKLYVQAYKVVDGKRINLGKSITGHIVGRKNTKYTNVKKITVSKTKYTLKKGKSITIKAKTVLVEKNKKQLSNSHAKEFRYASSNKAIAKVNSKGNITAVSKGKCNIYVYARNGYAKKLTVTVK